MKLQRGYVSVYGHVFSESGLVVDLCGLAPKLLLRARICHFHIELLVMLLSHGVGAVVHTRKYARNLVKSLDATKPALVLEARLACCAGDVQRHLSFEIVGD